MMNDLCIATIEVITPEEYQSGGEGWTMEYGFADTPFGQCFIAATPRGICSFQFVDGDGDKILSAYLVEWKKAEHKQNDSMAIAIVWDIFSDIPSKYAQPLKLHVKGTSFQIEVWETLLTIPIGAVVTYSELAQRVHRDKAVRAVASAVARNPVGLIIPCHRVIRSGGSIGQYHWRSERKANMIGWERAFSLKYTNFASLT